MSVEESDPSFANLDGRLGEERVMTGEEGIGIRGLVSDSRYGLGPARASAPTLEDRVRQGRPTKRAVDIPALMEVSFPGLGPVEEPRVMNGHTRRQLLAANNVGSGQRLDDCRSPSRDCPNCGAKGEKTHNKDTCPARNKVCFSCGIQGHYGRMCGKKKGLALVKGMYTPEMSVVRDDGRQDPLARRLSCTGQGLFQLRYGGPFWMSVHDEEGGTRRQRRHWEDAKRDVGLKV